MCEWGVVFTKYFLDESILHCTVWKSEQKKFRQINHLVISLDSKIKNSYFHEIFAKKVWVKLSLISTMWFGIMEILLNKNFVKPAVKLIWRNILPLRLQDIFTQCGNCGNLLSRFFNKNFVKATSLLKKLQKRCFHEKKVRWERITRFILNYLPISISRKICFA